MRPRVVGLVLVLAVGAGLILLVPRVAEAVGVALAIVLFTALLIDLFEDRWPWSEGSFPRALVDDLRELFER